MFLAIAGLILFWPPARNLEYEYAIATAWAVTFACIICGIFAPITWLQTKEKWNTLDFVLLAGLPLVAYLPGSFMFAVNLCPCSGPGYYFWMTLMVLPGGWLGIGLMLWIGRSRMSRSRIVRWGVSAFPFGLALVAAGLMWFFPQKRITSVLLGFLHGPIYDRWIAVDEGVVWSRIGHALIGLILIAVAGGIIKRGQWLYRVALMVAFAVLVVAHQAPSQGHGFAALNRELPDVIQIENIELRYKKRSNMDEEIAGRLASDAAFHVIELMTTLGTEISEPIRIYAYADSDQKKILFGGGHTDITDVWTPSVHIELEDSPHPTLRHELAHAVASYVSWHGIGFHPNMLLTEGLAMALAPTDQSLGFDQMAASMIQTGRFHSVENLMNPLGFWSESGSRSYVVAGSFLRWLSEKYGPAAVRTIYSGQSIANVTKDSPSNLMAAWKKDILEKHNKADDLVVESITRQPSVLDRKSVV